MDAGTQRAKGRASFFMKNSRGIFVLIVGAMLGALRGSAASPAFEERTIRLNEIAVHRYVPRVDGVVLERRYLLDARGGLTFVEDATVPVAVTIPEEAYDKVLLMGSAWQAYRLLGPVAFVNFELTTELPIVVANQMQFEVRASAEARLDGGKLINISTRGVVSATEKLIAGFVVTEQHRRVLVRAVGPTLAQFGVTGVLADPYVTILKGTMPLYFNDDWSKRPEAAETVSAARATGAFALPAGSKDAALVVELAPGAYTVLLQPEAGAGGVALVEVYSVP
ncbi:MAG: hypothetical protein NTV51_14285 [Verrucomicrobia bacterium]|nr:hypothetical protein [Verrucomicrobiota bacterium]